LRREQVKLPGPAARPGLYHFQEIRIMPKFLLPLLLACGIALPAQEIFSSEGCWFEDAASTGENVWLLCDKALLKVSRDGGNTFRDVRLPTADRKLRAVAFADNDTGIVAGERGLILRTSDGGRTWTQLPAVTEENLREAVFQGAHAWIAGHGGVILHSADHGQTWNRQNSSTTFPLESIHFANERHGWAAGWNGIILRTQNGGATWQPIHTEAANWSLRAITFRGEKEGWAVGFLGQLLHTADGGLTWTQLDSPLKGTLTSIAFDRNGQGWVASDQQLFTSTDGGRTWQPTNLSNWVFIERLKAGPQSVWAVSPFGVLRKPANSKDWQPVRFGGGSASASESGN
jgi:photosystem II stability/assembly factor-like uncharacterized protein